MQAADGCVALRRAIADTQVCTSGDNNPSLQRSLNAAIHAQLKPRWDDECRRNADVDRRGSHGRHARAFVAANIDWAKARVHARISRILWAPNARLASMEEPPSGFPADDAENV